MTHAVDPRIANWQTEEYELGTLVFSATEHAESLFPFYDLPAEATFLGLLEDDALCLLPDGSLAVYDHESNGRILCPAAQDQAHFLAAMEVLERHLERCDHDEQYWDDEAAGWAVRGECTKLAGGKPFKAFFSMLIGV